MALEGHKDYELFCEGQRSNATLQRALFPSDAKDSPFNGISIQDAKKLLKDQILQSVMQNGNFLDKFVGGNEGAPLIPSIIEKTDGQRNKRQHETVAGYVDVDSSDEGPEVIHDNKYDPDGPTPRDFPLGTNAAGRVPKSRALI